VNRSGLKWDENQAGAQRSAGLRRFGKVGSKAILAFVLLAGTANVPTGCSPAQYRRGADSAAYSILGEAQQRTLGRREPFTIESPGDALRRKLLIGQDLPRCGPASLGSDQLEPIDHWPEKNYPGRDSQAPPAEAPWLAQAPLKLTLTEALAVAARNSREYQAKKEGVFRAALALDLEANEFRNILSGEGESTYEHDLSGDESVRGLANSATAGWRRKLKSGTLLTAEFAVDLARLLTQGQASALGLFADATITIPLLRGAGKHIVAEPLTQAERDVAYALWEFERFKRTLAVKVASEYLDVLRQLDQVRNAQENYKGLMASTRRARCLADEGRLSRIQVDQSFQNELRARDGWISAQQSYQRKLDSLKITLGLPTDANIVLDTEELQRLTDVARALPKVPVGPAAGADATSQPATAPAADAPITLQPPSKEGGRLEMPEAEAVETALSHRLDLRKALGEVYDAQRRVVVAADALKMGLSLAGSARMGGRRSLGSVSQDDAQIRFEKGVYTAGVLLNLPLERTAERNAYREALIALEQAVRNVQALEDQIKRQVREALRKLLQARESYQIQMQATALARKRVESTELFLELGRAEIRDLLEAQESLLSAQNALTAALVNYRIAELELQRDMGVLEVDHNGNWSEYEP